MLWIALAAAAVAHPNSDNENERAPSFPPAPVATSGFDGIAFDGAAFDDFDIIEDGWYFQLGGGFVSTADSNGPGEEIDFEEGVGAILSVGHRFPHAGPLAFDNELELIWTDQDVSDSGILKAVSDVNTLSALLNGVGDYSFTETFSLYGGAGLGFSFVDVGTRSDSLNDFDDEDGPLLTWQVKTGGRFQMSESTSFSVGYRFVNIDDHEIDDDIGGASFDLKTEQHILEIGYRFGI